MQAGRQVIQRGIPRFASGQRLTLQKRQVSLTGAIEKGIRHGKRAVESRGRDWAQTSASDPGWKRRVRPEQDVANRTSRKDTEDQEALFNDGNTGPQAIPYSQPDSQFLYGTFTIKAALDACRRQLRTLYIYVARTQEREKGKAVDGDDLDKVARGIKGLVIKKVSGFQWLRLLDKMSEGRPHNGYILEASPLPLPLLSQLPRPEIAEDKQTQRFPFYLFLDQIVDPGNLGNIIRSAYFFGVDGIILLRHDTAPLTAVSLKASAGAAEFVPISLVTDEVEFIRRSQRNGWRFFGASVSPTESAKNDTRPSETKDQISSALSSHPTVLVLGSEAKGIRPRIARTLDAQVSIKTLASHPGIDSLNVGTAAALLIRDFVSLHGPAASDKKPEGGESSSNFLYGNHSNE